MKPGQLFFACLGAVAITIACGTAMACNVPVFRYALERWPPDAYELIVFHEGPLTDEQQTLIERLEEKIIQDEYYVRTFDMAEIPETFPSEEEEAEQPASQETPDDTDPAEDTDSETAETADESDDGAEDPDDGAVSEKTAPKKPDLRKAVRELFDSLEADQLPWLLVRYPRSYADDPPAYSGPLTPETIDALLDSPTRREIARRILDGDSVVWLLVQSGDAKQDAEAEKVLNKQLKELMDELELPELEEEDQQYMEADAAPALRLAFSLLTVSRSDASERMFLQLLDAWDPEAVDKTKPMAFAFFGRGRALGPLTGEDLVPEVVADACFYLTGPCSCQIKQQNPGFDMLMSVDWEGVIYGEYTLAEALPRLTTAAAVVEDNLALQKAIGVGAAAAATAATATQTQDGDPVESENGDATQPLAATASAAPDESSDAESRPPAAPERNSFMLYVSAVVAAGVVIVLLGSLAILGRQRGKGSDPA